MRFFETPECLAICWSADGSAYGVRAKTSKGIAEIVSFAKQDPAALGGAAALASNEERLAAICAGIAKIHSELDPAGELHAIAGGPVPGEMVFELCMPALKRKEDLASALEFELPRQTPARLDEIVWQSRRAERHSSQLPSQSDGSVENETKSISSNSIVRIWTAPKKVFERMLDAFAASGLKLDEIVNPFMAELPPEASDDVCMPFVESGYAFRRNAGEELFSMEGILDAAGNGERFAKSLQASFSVNASDPGFDAVRYAPCLALAWHALKGSGRKGEVSGLALPGAMRPRRFKSLKIACMALLALNAALALSFAGRVSFDKWQRLDRIKDEKASIQAKISKIRASNASMSEVDKALKSIETASTGNAEALNCLQFLGESLPERAWLSDFNVGPEKIDLSVRSDGEWESESFKWDKSGQFAAESIRKRRNPDGSAETTLRIASKTELARK